jgi:hypothetical protein
MPLYINSSLRMTYYPKLVAEVIIYVILKVVFATTILDLILCVHLENVYININIIQYNKYNKYNRIYICK